MSLAQLSRAIERMAPHTGPKSEAGDRWVRVRMTVDGAAGICVQLQRKNGSWKLMLRPDDYETFTGRRADDLPIVDGGPL